MKLVDKAKDNVLGKHQRDGLVIIRILTNFPREKEIVEEREV